MSGSNEESFENIESPSRLEEADPNVVPPIPGSDSEEGAYLHANAAWREEQNLLRERSEKAEFALCNRRQTSLLKTSILNRFLKKLLTSLRMPALFAPLFLAASMPPDTSSIATPSLL